MDYDADGVPDFISGSYDPGDLYLFRGLGKGKYAARQLLRDEHEVPLVHHPNDLVIYHDLQKRGRKADANGKKDVYFRVASFGSWPAMVDWDADGDLDMLIGSFGGQLYLRMNKGTRQAPVFAAESVQVRVGAAPLEVPGHLDPVVADWDGDGRWDIVAGAADGSVSCFPNTGTAAAPAFGARQELLPASAKNKFKTQYLDVDETPARGTRAQICVTDYDGDGALDLLVGDYSDVWRLRESISAADHKALAALAADEARQLAQQDTKDPSALAKIVKAKSAYYEKQGRQSFVWLFLRNRRSLDADRR